MNKKNYVQHLLFCGSILLLILNNWVFYSDKDVNIGFLKLILFSCPSIYIVVYVSHMIVFQHFIKLKNLFYTNRLRSIERLISDKQRIKDEFGDNYLSNLLVNFFVIYFLVIVPPAKLLTKLPGMENVEVKGLSETVGLVTQLLSTTPIEYLAPFTVTGFIIIYILKFVRRRQTSRPMPKQNNNKKHSEYPGTTALLGFLYTVLSIIIIQLFIIVFGLSKDSPTMSEYLITLLISVLFAGFGSFATIIAIMADHILFKKFQPENDPV